VNPYAIEVMREIGIDIGKHASKCSRSASMADRVIETHYHVSRNCQRRHSRHRARGARSMV